MFTNTLDLVNSIRLDEYPGFATCVDFGITDKEHYEAIYYPFRAGEITVYQLDAALGDGPALTLLVNGCNTNILHKGIVFVTPYDNMTEEEPEFFDPPEDPLNDDSDLDPDPPASGEFR